MLPNQEIRKELRRKGIYTWELAKELKIHETTLYRYLRSELPLSQKNKYLTLISKLANEKGE